jgi:hypothetical protein
MSSRSEDQRRDLSCNHRWRFGRQCAFTNPIMSNKARWSILAVLLAVTAVAGSHQALRFRSSREWVTISLPNPPGPLPDVTVASTKHGL